MKDIQKKIKETLSNYNLFKIRIEIIKIDLEVFRLIQLDSTKEKVKDLKNELKQLMIIIHNIDNILQHLNIQEREIIVKKYILKYTWKNIANELQISSKTCQCIGQSALNKIIKILLMKN